MNELMKNLKFQLERAIGSYISTRAGTSNLSKRRASDIQDLRRILTIPSPDIYSKLKEIKSRLNKMKTGWWIFDFGHSKLKNLIENEIKNFKKIHVNAYIALQPNTPTFPVQQVVQIPEVQRTKTEKFSVSASKNFLQFKPKAKIQNSKPMLKLDTETSLQNIDFLM